MILNQCDYCRHFERDKQNKYWDFNKGTSGAVCKAFPNGIPTKYTMYLDKNSCHPGGIPHDKIEPEQEGDYVFERK